MMDKGDDATLEVLAALNEKGWLKLDEAGVRRLEAAAAGGERQRLLAVAVTGEWAGSSKTAAGDTRSEDSQRVVVGHQAGANSGTMTVRYRGVTSVFRDSKSSSSSWTMRVEAPGTATYSSSFGGRATSHTAEGSCDVKLEGVAFDASNGVLSFRREGQMTVHGSDGTTYPLPMELKFFYAYDAASDSLLSLSEQEAKAGNGDWAALARKEGRLVLKRQGQAPSQVK